MITIILARPVPGRQFFPYGRTAQRATAVICKKRGLNEKRFSIGVGSLSEGKHLFFEEVAAQDAQTLWRGMYAISKMLYICEKSVEIAVLIAGKEPLNEKIEQEAKEYLSCDYHTAAALRQDVYSQVVPLEDIKKIVSGIKTEEQMASKLYRRTARLDARNQLAFLMRLGDLRNRSPRPTA